MAPRAPMRLPFPNCLHSDTADALFVSGAAVAELFVKFVEVKSSQIIGIIDSWAK